MCSMNGSSKLVGKSVYAILISFLMMIPLLLYPVIMINGGIEYWPYIFVEIPWCALVLLIGGRSFFGFITFSDENMVIRTFKPYSFDEEDFSFSINYKEICGISFITKDGTKNNETNYKMRTYSVPMVELTDIYDSKHYILLYPFSRKQWFLIEKEILNHNPEILVLNSAEELHRKTKY